MGSSAYDLKNAGKANKRANAAEQRGRARREKGEFNLDLLPWLNICALQACLANQQGALRFGLTRDGGALALGMYRGDDYTTEYIRPTEDVAEAINEIADVWLDNGRDDLTAWMTRQQLPK